MDFRLELLSLKQAFLLVSRNLSILLVGLVIGFYGVFTRLVGINLPLVDLVLLAVSAGWVGAKIALLRDALINGRASWKKTGGYLWKYFWKFIWVWIAFLFVSFVSLFGLFFAMIRWYLATYPDRVDLAGAGRREDVARMVSELLQGGLIVDFFSQDIFVLAYWLLMLVSIVTVPLLMLVVTIVVVKDYSVWRALKLAVGFLKQNGKFFVMLVATYMVLSLVYGVLGSFSSFAEAVDVGRRLETQGVTLKEVLLRAGVVCESLLMGAYSLVYYVRVSGRDLEGG